MKRNYKVLIIEDENDWINKLRSILEGEGCRVAVCRTAAEAFNALSRELFHFATVDLKLLEDVRKYRHLDQAHKWEGWEILRFIKEKSLQSTMGTAVITYYPFEEFEQKATKELGAVYFMSKRNFDTESFVKTLRSYLDDYHNVYFNEGLLANSKVADDNLAITETERFAAAFLSVDGLREYFRAKENAGLKTIVLFSDLCDSTSYKDQRGFVDGLFKSFSHNEKVSRIIKEHGGTVVKTIGDCVMGRFDTNSQNQGELATRALDAAIRIHELFDDLNVGISKDLEKYRSRTGVSMGVTGDNYDGDPHGLAVDVAARLTSLAKPEQVLVSRDLIETANIMQLSAQVVGTPPLRLKATELVSESQMRKLKGVENPVAVCEIKWDGKERGIQQAQLAIAV